MPVNGEPGGQLDSQTAGHKIRVRGTHLLHDLEQAPWPLSASESPSEQGRSRFICDSGSTESASLRGRGWLQTGCPHIRGRVSDAPNPSYAVPHRRVFPTVSFMRQSPRHPSPGPWSRPEYHVTQDANAVPTQP